MKRVENVVEYKSLDELYHLDRNPRTISKENMNKLVESIKANPDYFEARPIICSDRTGKLVIIAGNQRLRAAGMAGLSEVPVVVLHGLTEEREKEITIRDNVELGEWDFEMLANEFEVEDLEDWGLDNFKTGIKDEKEIEQKEPTITSSFITFDYADEIELKIKDETAAKLMQEMVNYRQEHGNYDGFWDERLR